MVDLEVVRFVHGLALLVDDYVLDTDGWPKIALSLEDLITRWPAAVDLARMSGAEESEIEAKVFEFAEQLDESIGDHPRMDPWDAVAGSYGRTWRMGLLDAFDAIVHMKNVSWHATVPDDPDRQGAELILSARGAYEMGDLYEEYGPCTPDCGSSAIRIVEHFGTPILTKADALLREDAIPQRLCYAVRAAQSAAGH
ncbi:hypothetical protein LTV02_39115 [Nocardia yamanashiensis]|uniref:hypothetical protein n=1 Tax=Nocardia yamanashiensis TaxID=209247 RepID=UPI001E512FBD|nr:hypothetical protein [Nocardia yamanashiensis]UGT41844.1 hypothetical protein LTV02_39115 [Nocardia yamanashiensis]